VRVPSSRPDADERPVVVAIDHRFVPDGADSLAQGVYDAFGALDAACPEAILTLSADDLAALVHASRRWLAFSIPTIEERVPVEGAIRRCDHVLERRSAPPA
jgi:hypothetical protein